MILFCLGKRLPTVNALAICIAQRYQDILAFVKIVDTIPNINAGPALLQKPSIRLAAVLDSFPEKYAFEMIFAPIGYPPRSPNNKIDSAPVGILQRLLIGCRMRIFFPENVVIIIPESIIKGNNAGMTVFRHSAIPSSAPSITVFVSSIIIAIATQHIAP